MIWCFMLHLVFLFVLIRARVLRCLAGQDFGDRCILRGAGVRGFPDGTRLRYHRDGTVHLLTRIRPGSIHRFNGFLPCSTFSFLLSSFYRPCVGSTLSLTLAHVSRGAAQQMASLIVDYMRD